MKSHMIRFVSVLLTLTLLLLCFVSCAGKGKTLLSIERDGKKATFSVNHYQLLLSRLKGAFVSYGYTNESGAGADSDKFWAVQDTLDGKTLQTWDDYYRGQVLNDCRTYTVALWLFEKNGLKLTETAEDAIQQEMDDLINDFGNGSKTKLNAVLSEYGVNYDLLKNFYTVDAKVDALKLYLYGANASGLGNNVKDQYLNDHYLRFKQIFFANYDYVYETDKNGDAIRYDKDTNLILYDAVNGYPKADESGKNETDKDGQTIYYTDKTYSHICYDTVKGVRSVANDANGNPMTKPLSESALAELDDYAEEAFDRVEHADEMVFESVLAEENEPSEFTDGYYLTRGANYSGLGSDLSYLSIIATELERMEVGDVILLKSDNGYHIIRKYTPTSGAYDNEVNEVWFTGFADALIDEVFLNLCREYFDSVVLDEKVFATVPPIREIKANISF